MTRACVSLAQGKFATAWGYHPFVFFVVLSAIDEVKVRVRQAEGGEPNDPFTIRNALAQHEAFAVRLKTAPTGLD